MSSTRRVNAQGGFRYTVEKQIGEGAFATVYLIYALETGERVALKKIVEDPRYKSRELQILQTIHHPNCISLLHYFTTEVSGGKTRYQNIVTEYVPETLSSVERQYLSIGQVIPSMLIKIISYQLLRALAYLHAKRICHRDIKPSNILLHPSTCLLKLCDFGSAKFIRPNEPSISYITSRPYRAPELILGSQKYNGAVDIWSAGCVITEMLIGQPLFNGENNSEQLLSIFQILGTPSRQQLLMLNPQLQNVELPSLAPLPWASAFRASTDPLAVDLVSKLCVLNPSSRLSGYDALIHPYFDELRLPTTRLPNNRDLPSLFEFTQEEVSFIGLERLRMLVPASMQLDPWFIERTDPSSLDKEEEEEE